MASPPQEPGLVLGLIEALAHVPRSRLLDRLIQGRISIAFVAFALIGIVTMQLGLLKLNAGIGRALEHEALLQRENAALSIENSELAAGDRVELQAARLGMGLTSPGDLRFLTLGSPSFEARRAASALRTPVVAAAAASPMGAMTTGEGLSGASTSASAGASSNESEAAGGSEAAGTEVSSATPASSVSSAPSAAPSGTVGNTTSSEAASATSQDPPTGAGETSGLGPASGASPASSSGPSAATGAAAVASPASTGGGATAPSG